MKTTPRDCLVKSMKPLNINIALTIYKTAYVNSIKYHTIHRFVACKIHRLRLGSSYVVCCFVALSLHRSIALSLRKCIAPRCTAAESGKSRKSVEHGR